MSGWVVVAGEFCRECGESVLDQRALSIGDHFARQTQGDQYPGADGLWPDEHQVYPLAADEANFSPLDDSEVSTVVRVGDDLHGQRQTHFR